MTLFLYSCFVLLMLWLHLVDESCITTMSCVYVLLCLFCWMFSSVCMNLFSCFSCTIVFCFHAILCYYYVIIKRSRSTINCFKGQLCLTRLSRLFSNRKVAGSPALPAVRRSALEQDTEPQSAPDEKWAPGQETLSSENECVCERINVTSVVKRFEHAVEMKIQNFGSDLFCPLLICDKLMEKFMLQAERDIIQMCTEVYLKLFNDTNKHVSDKVTVSLI